MYERGGPSPKRGFPPEHIPRSISGYFFIYGRHVCSLYHELSTATNSGPPGQRQDSMNTLIIIAVVSAAAVVAGVIYDLVRRNMASSVASTLKGEIEEASREMRKHRLRIEDLWEAEVADTNRLWPYIAKDPAAIVAIIAMFGAIAMNLNYSLVMGLNIAQGAILFILFTCLDLAVPVLMLNTGWDPRGGWYFKKVNPMTWAIATASVVASAYVGLHSMTSLKSRAAAVDTYHETRLATLRDDIKSYTAQIKEIDARIGGGSYRKYKKLHEEWAEKADRESERKFCGTKCENYKSQAAIYAAHAADAKRRDELFVQRSRAMAALSRAAGQQTSSSGFGQFMRGYGVSDPEAVSFSGFVFVLIMFLAVHPLYWRLALTTIKDARYTDQEAKWRHLWLESSEYEGGTAWFVRTFGEEIAAKMGGLEGEFARRQEEQRRLAKRAASDIYVPPKKEAPLAEVPAVNAEPDIPEGLGKEVEKEPEKVAAANDQEVRELKIAAALKLLAEQQLGKPLAPGETTNITVQSNDANPGLRNDHHFSVVEEFVNGRTFRLGADVEGGVSVNDLWNEYRNSLGDGDGGMSRPVFEQKLALVVHARDDMRLVDNILPGWGIKG